MAPALLTSTSSLSKRARTSRPSVRTDSISDRSAKNACARRAQLFDSGVGLGAVARHQDHFGAAPPELDGGGATEPGRRAGDEHALACHRAPAVFGAHFWKMSLASILSPSSTLTNIKLGR